MGKTIDDLLHMIGGLEMTLRTTFSIGLGACDLRVTWYEKEITRHTLLKRINNSNKENRNRKGAEGGLDTLS